MNRLHDICHYYILEACCEGYNLFYNDVCLIDSCFYVKKFHQHDLIQSVVIFSQCKILFDTNFIFIF